MAVAIVAGALANKPHNGGEAWVRLNWVLGLRRLGLDVYFVEQIESAACVDAAGAPAPDFGRSANLHYFRDVTRRFGLSSDSCALLCDGGHEHDGLSPDRLAQVCRRADVLLNISGHLRLDELLRPVPRRVYVDIDPGFTQIWHAQGGDASLGLERHTDHVTVGWNVGTPGCPIPTGGFRWRPIRPPVVLDEWPAVPPPPAPPVRFTTIASWRGPFGPLEWGGQTLGLKVHEFRKVLDLPRRSPQHFEVALNIHPADGRDRAALLDAGWRLTDPAAAARDPDAFRAYVQTSGAEFSAAQGVYVHTRSGWFSDRTAVYLASGRPALVQDTGLGESLPGGAGGLVTFQTPEQAAAGAKSIASDYPAHTRAARRLAETHFDSDRVLGQLLEDAGLRGTIPR